METTEAVLVTGASGFIGTHLVQELKRRDIQVVCHSGSDGDIAECELPYVRVGHVFHLAGLSYVPDSWSRSRDYYRTNLLGTVNVLEFCRTSGSSLTLMSSYVYGQPLRLPVDEDHPVRALNPYSHTKILAEQTTRYYAEQFGIRATIIRSFNTYGFGQSQEFLIPKLMGQALDPICREIIVADTRPRRDFLYISDLVDLLISTLEQRVAGTYNAGSGASSSIADILDSLWALGVAAKPLRSENKPRAEEVLDVVADISKAKRDLGWSPQVGMRDGIARMLNSMRSNRVS